jgi:hypothetical protein
MGTTQLLKKYFNAYIAHGEFSLYVNTIQCIPKSAIQAGVYYFNCSLSTTKWLISFLTA